MKRNKPDTFEFETIKTGHYAVICSGTTGSPGHTVGIGYLFDRIQKLCSDLTKNVSCSASTAIVIEEMPNIVLKLAVPRKRQGALMSVVDAPATPGSAGSGALTSRTENASTIEQSAMAEAEAIARAAIQRTKGAIDAADALVERAESESLSLEEAIPTFAASIDETVTRNTFCRARGPEQVISFLGDERTLGGGHDIPNQLFSRATFSLANCRVASWGKSHGRYLLGNAHDAEWQRLVEWSGIVVDQLDGDEDSNEMLLLRLAEAINQPVDVDVCVKERTATKGRRLVPLEIRNRSEIIAALNERLELMTV